MTIDVPGRPAPAKLDLIGVQDLVKFPDVRVILVHGEANHESAQRLFPANPVLAWEGGVIGLGDYYLGHFRTRNVIIWPPNPLPQVVRALADLLADWDAPTANMMAFAPDRPEDCWNPTDYEARNLPRRLILNHLKPLARPAAAIEAPAAPTVAPPSVEASPVAAVDVPAAIEAAKTDAGALFEPPVLAAVAAMRRDTPAEYQRIRAQIKETAASVTELDRLTGPKASVTPITEARTRQQEKENPEPLPGEEGSPLCDDALAVAFTAAHPELRYVAHWGRWLRWDDMAGWTEDTTLNVFDMARRVCKTQATAYRFQVTPDVYTKARSAAKRTAVENLARSDRAHASSVDAWDADKLVLNTPGGVCDLTNGSVRPTRLDDYCLKRTAASVGDPALAVQWLDFLRYGTNGDEALIGFLRRWAGLNATGLTREQKFVFIHGRGGAGKGTFLNTIARVLGTYARKIAMDTLTEQQRTTAGASHAEDLVRLAGARMGYAAETQQGKRWNEARIKELTGEDTITARAPYAPASIEFLPQIKLTIMGNHPPGLRSVGNEMRRRLLIVPFDHLPPVPDPLLGEKLWEERDHILSWMVAGAIEWQCDGLQPPPCVVKASAQYFDNQDITGQWISDCCELTPGVESTIRTLHASYVAYVEPSGYQPLRQGELRDELLTRAGITRSGYEKAPTIKGIRVKVDASASSGRFAD